MRKTVLICLSAVLYTVCASCNSESRLATKPDVPRNNLHKLTIRGVTAYVEISSTRSKRALGLMYRKSLPEDQGMLFVYPDSQKRSFWMKNTYIPLSLAYISEDGRIFQIVDMKPLDESSYHSVKPAQYVLEVNNGWFKRNGIEVGDIIENLPSAEGAEY